MSGIPNLVNRYPIPLQIYRTKTRFLSITTGFLYEDSGKMWLITARHNTYYTSPDVNIYHPKIDYKEIPIERMVLHFKESKKTRRKWDRLVLFQDEIMKYGRTSKDLFLDIAAIDISVFLGTNSLKKNNFLNHLSFRRAELSDDFDQGTDIYIAGFPCDYSLHETEPLDYHGKVFSKEDRTDIYGRYLFQIDCAPPHGVSGSPVVSYRKPRDKEIALCGIYAAHHTNEIRGIASYAHYIEDIIKFGERINKEVLRQQV